MYRDVGQIYDPWVYLGCNNSPIKTSLINFSPLGIAAQTKKISLATGSIILPLRHPLHTAKAATSVDQVTRISLP